MRWRLLPAGPALILWCCQAAASDQAPMPSWTTASAPSQTHPIIVITPIKMMILFTGRKCLTGMFRSDFVYKRAGGDILPTGYYADYCGTTQVGYEAYGAGTNDQIQAQLNELRGYLASGSLVDDYPPLPARMPIVTLANDKEVDAFFAWSANRAEKDERVAATAPPAQTVSTAATPAYRSRPATTTAAGGPTAAAIAALHTQLSVRHGTLSRVSTTPNEQIFRSALGDGDTYIVRRTVSGLACRKLSSITYSCGYNLHREQRSAGSGGLAGLAGQFQVAFGGGPTDAHNSYVFTHSKAGWYSRDLDAEFAQEAQEARQAYDNAQASRQTDDPFKEQQQRNENFRDLQQQLDDVSRLPH